MKELLREKKKKKGNWRRKISIVIALAMLFSILPTNLVLFKLKLPDFGRAAVAANDIKVIDQRSNELQKDGTYIMPEEYQYIEATNLPAGATCEWTAGAFLDPLHPAVGVAYVIVGSETTGTAEGNRIQLRSNSLGRELRLSLVVKNADGSVYGEFNVNIKVNPLIIGPDTVKVNPDDPNDVRVKVDMRYLSSGAKKKSLILRKSAGKIYIDNTKDYEEGDSEKLRLLLASGTGDATTKVLWENGDSSVLTLKVTGTGAGTGDERWYIEPRGVGHTTLKVNVEDKNGNPLGDDEIDVYVNPELTFSNLTAEQLETSGSDGVVFKDGDEVILDNLEANSAGVMDAKGKVDWVVWQEIGDQDVLVSEHYHVTSEEVVERPGTNYDDKDANFYDYPGSTNKSYVFHTRPGVYWVRFFPAGIYKNPDKLDDVAPLLVPTRGGIPEEVGFGFKIKVKSVWEDQNISINVGGSYNVAKALGIPENLFGAGKDFEIIEEGDQLPPNSVTQSSSNYAVLQANNEKEGKAVYKVIHKKTSSSAPELYGVAKHTETPEYIAAHPTETFEWGDNEILITINVKDSFRLNSAAMVLRTSQTDIKRPLWGVFATGKVPVGSTFRWECTGSDSSVNWKDYLELPEDFDKESSSQYLEYISTKNKALPSGKVIRISLHWTYQGLTQTASCAIEIEETANAINIDNPKDDPIRMELGDEKQILISTVGGSVDTVEWISSDPSVFEVVESEEDIPGQKHIKATGVGRATLLLINSESPQVMKTRDIIVIQRITGITITGENILKMTGDGTAEVPLSAGSVQLYANLEPSDPKPTETDVVWSIKESVPGGIATIDAKTGKLTFNGLEGVVTVQVEPADNSSREVAKRIAATELKISIKATPVTALTVAESEIWVIRGETREIEYTITPKDAYDANNIVVKAGDDGKFATATIDHDKFLVKINGVAATPANSLTTVTVSCSTLGTTVEPVTIKVHVTEPLTSIAFNQGEYTVQVGKTIDMSLIYDPPENVDKSSVELASENPEIASIVPTVENGDVTGGVITGVKAGTVTIHAFAEELGMKGMISCVVHVIEPIVVADEFSIDPEKKTIKEGETFEIVPIFTPANPTDQTVEYTSSDESVATVSPEGIVKGISVSEVPVMITCTYVPNGKVAICMVTVESRVKLKLSPTKKTLVKGRSFTIKKTVTPTKFKDTPAQWKSSNTKIATVSQSGKVKTKKVGTCIITCTLVNYKVKATCTVKVTKVKTTIKLNKSSIRINVGQTYTLKSTVTSNDTVKPSVRFSTKNKKIATVGAKTGKIKGKKVGSTIIIARTTDKARATARCRVTVIRRATSLDLNKHYALCYVGGTIRLKASIKPKSTSIKKLQWSTSDNTIASVDQNGKISGLIEGEVYISVKTTDGSNLSDRCYVKIIDKVPASSIMIAQTKLTMKKGDTANLTYKLLPTNTTDSVTMASDNKRVATVTNDGKITAVGTGSATITIMTTSGTTTTVEVHVVELNKSSVKIRQYDTETLIVTGSDETVTWYSDNNRIATVQNGTITGRAIGTTYVHAYIDGCKLSCRVQVVSVNNEQR